MLQGRVSFFSDTSVSLTDRMSKYVCIFPNKTFSTKKDSGHSCDTSAKLGITFFKLILSKDYECFILWRSIFIRMCIILVQYIYSITTCDLAGPVHIIRTRTQRLNAACFLYDSVRRLMNEKLYSCPICVDYRFNPWKNRPHMYLNQYMAIFPAHVGVAVSHTVFDMLIRMIQQSDSVDYSR